MARSHLVHFLRAGAVAAAACLTAACAKAPQPPKAGPPVVASTVAAYGTIRPSEQLAGIVAPYQNVAISTTLAEPADAVYVQEGDTVHAGQVLARLDTADLQATLDADIATAQSDAATTQHTVYQGNLTISQGVDALRTAQTAVRQAQTNLDRDTTDLSRYRELLAKGYISQQQVAQQAATVQNDQQALRSAQAGLESAQSAVAANGSLSSGGLQSSSVAQSQATERVGLAQAQQQRVLIAKATIVSPIAGVVVNRNLNPGEYPGTRQLFTIQQVDPIYAVLRGSGAQIARIKTGAKATIVASDLGGRKLSGRVAGVLNQINPGSTDFQVKVALANPGALLRPGMAVQGVIDLPQAGGMRVPATAFTDDSHSHVLTVGDDGTVSAQPVTEIANDGKSAVVAGLAPGARVIDDGQSSVSAGQKVAVR
jgi:multidrug efflux pump subunit AcrA (membrane-fusion protein)